MLVWRLARASHQALDGEGARLYGGRWNPEGVAVVYASTTLALAALEFLGHVDPEDVPADLVAMQVLLPSDLSSDRVRRSDLSGDWATVPDHPACLRVGASWATRGAALVLFVPSALVPEEDNVLINPGRPDAVRLAVVHTRPFSFDPRLLI